MLRPKEGAVRASSEWRGNLGGNSPAGKDRLANYTLVFTPTGACGPLSASLTEAESERRHVGRVAARCLHLALWRACGPKRNAGNSIGDTGITVAHWEALGLVRIRASSTAPGAWTPIAHRVPYGLAAEAYFCGIRPAASLQSSASLHRCPPRCCSAARRTPRAYGICASKYARFHSWANCRASK